jgi:hypothetical protein
VRSKRDDDSGDEQARVVLADAVDAGVYASFGSAAAPQAPYAKPSAAYVGLAGEATQMVYGTSAYAAPPVRSSAHGACAHWHLSFVMRAIIGM